MSRSALGARIWEGAPSANANVNLRQFLRRLRSWEKEAGVQILGSDDHTVWRDATMVGSDVSAFLAMPEVRTADDLRQLNEWYGGDLLSDVTPGADESGAWIGEERARLRERFLQMAFEGAQRIGGQAGSDVLQRLSAEAPYDDTIVRARMVLANGALGAQAARKIYDSYVERLKRDMQIEPEPATQALLRELVPGAGVAATAVEAQPRVRSLLASVPKVLILPPAQSLAGVGRETEILGMSLVDEVTFSLSQTRTFAVFAPHTARQLATAAFPGGNPYGADYVLNTRFVAGPQNTLKLAVSLTDVATHELLLSESLNFTPDALLTDHHRLATALETRLTGSIGRVEVARYRSTGSASAYVHYLLGAESIKTFDLQPVRRARTHFKRAITLSPGFALARANLARSLSLEWVLLGRDDMEPIKIALETAQRAVEDDPMNPIAHREVGNALLYLDRLDEAVALLETAVSLGPHHADILFNYADGLTHIGRNGEARSAMDRALALNPLPPDLYYWVSAIADYALEHYSAASDSLKKLQQPESAARVIAAVEAKNGNLEEAYRQRDIYLSRHPNFRLADYRIPQRSKVDREHYLDGLRMAGFN